MKLGNAFYTQINFEMFLGKDSRLTENDPITHFWVENHCFKV